MTKPTALLTAFLTATTCCGCASPYHTDRGALVGGLTGAGVGAIVGDTVGNPLAGAAIGAGMGTLAGAVVGNNLDEIEARNRAQIEYRIGRPVAPGAVSTADVVAMSTAGVDPNVIVKHVQIHGTASRLETADLIYLQRSGVDPRVVQAMQSGPIATASAPAPPPRVVVEEHYYAAPRYYGPAYRHFPRHRRYHRHHPHHSPRVSWGISFGSNH